MIRHVASIAEIVEDMDAAVEFYRNSLGLIVEHEEGSPYAVVKIPGILHYGLWARRAAAKAVYGTEDEAERVPLGISIGFEVDNVKDAQNTLEERGIMFVQETRQEPWGQITGRFFSKSGALLEIAETPWARALLHDAKVAE